MMSRPLGSSCCDWEVDMQDEFDEHGDYIFTCVKCGEKCEAVE